jgi:hypothetical protein
MERLDMQYVNNEFCLKAEKRIIKRFIKDSLIILIIMFLMSGLVMFSTSANAASLDKYTCVFDEDNYTLNNVVSNLFVNNFKKKNIKFNELKQGDFVSFPEISKSKTQDVKKFGQDNHQYFYKFKLCYK